MFTLQTTHTGQNMQSNFYFADVFFFPICVGVARFSLLTYGDLNTEKQTHVHPHERSCHVFI